eukprot:scaffold663909_cov48-Prasinocladus_malaysianus.AAC.1
MLEQSPSQSTLPLTALSGWGAAPVASVLSLSAGTGPATDSLRPTVLALLAPSASGALGDANGVPKSQATDSALP